MSGQRARHIQTSFSSGELAPELHGRVDLQQYQNGLEECANFIVKPHGGLVNRPGLEHVCEVKNSSAVVRLIPFNFNQEQTYVLEFGNQYMRVITGGGLVTEDAETIVSTTEDDPVEVTVTGHLYATGDHVYISGVQIATSLNGRWFEITYIDANTFSLQSLAGDDIDGTGIGLGEGGEVERAYVLTTPYLTADLPDLDYTQSADTMTIVHPDWTPRELTRADHDDWTLHEITFGPTISRPQNLTITASGTYEYAITAVNEETGEESRASIIQSSYVAPTTVTWSAVTGASGYNVYRSDAGSGRKHGLIGTTTGPSFEDPGGGADDEIEPEWAISPPEAYNPFGGNPIAIDDVGTFDPCVVTTVGNHGYSTGDRIYIDDESDETVITDDGGHSFNNNWYTITVTAPTTFSLQDEDGEDVDGTGGDWTAGGNVEKFDGNDNCPSCVTYYEQRLIFAATNNDPQKIWMSQSAAFHNMDTSRPSRDSDAIIFTIAAQQVNRIRNLVPMRDLIILTAGGEWRANGGESEVMTATGGLAVRMQTTYGSGTLPAITVGNTTIYYQERGPSLRTIAYSFADDQYMGVDLSILSQHLLTGYSLSEWAYAQSPYGVIWCVRNDGDLLGLTYQQEHKVWAWHHHETSGEFESAVSVIEDAVDAVYVVVKREINGSDVRCIERMHERNNSDKASAATSVRDAFFVDGGLSLDNPIAISAITQAEPAQVTTSAAHGLTQGDYVDISDAGGMTEANDHQYKAGWVLASGVAITDISAATQAVVTSAAHGLLTGQHVFITGLTPTGAGSVADLLNDGDYVVTRLGAGSYRLDGIDTQGLTPATAGTGYGVSQTAFYLLDPDIAEKTIAGATQESPVEITTTYDHGYATGDEVYIELVGGMIEINRRWFTVTVTDTDAFTLDSEDGTGHTAYTSGGTVVANAIDSTEYTAYTSGGYARKAFTTIRGLDHLEGESVTILANGMKHPDETVSSGAITLDYPASRVHAGLGYTSQIRSVALEIPSQEGTIQGLRQSVSSVILRVEDSVGFSAGPDEDSLIEAKWRSDYETYDQPVAMYTGDVEPVMLEPNWDRGAFIVVRQSDPLPLAINAIIAEVQIGS